MRGYFFSNGLFIVPPDVDNCELTSSGGVMRDSRDFMFSTQLSGDNYTKIFEDVTEIVIQEGISDIPEEAFSNYVNLKKITLPSSLRSIRRQAFSNCVSLTSVEVPEGVTFIDWCVFFQCTALRYAHLPSSVSEMNGSVFFGCTALTEANIPDGLTTLADGTFQQCKSLSAIIIPEGITTIEDYAFANSGITQFYLPSTISNLGSGSLSSVNAKAYIPSQAPFARTYPHSKDCLIGAQIIIVKGSAKKLGLNQLLCPYCHSSQITEEAKHELFSWGKFFSILVLSLVGYFTGDKAAVLLSVVAGFFGRSVTVCKCKKCNCVWQKPRKSFSKDSFFQWWMEF